MPESPDLLVGDAERASAATELREHYDAGRLTLEEFEHRPARTATSGRSGCSSAP